MNNYSPSDDEHAVKSLVHCYGYVNIKHNSQAGVIAILATQEHN